MSDGIPGNTPQGKEEHRKQEAETKRRLEKKYSDALKVVRQHDGHRNQHYQNNDYVPCNLGQSRFDVPSRFDYNINNSHGSGEVSLHNHDARSGITSVSHALSLKDQLRIISSSLNMYTYGGDRPPFDNEYHPNKVLKDFVELVKEDKWTLDMIKANGGERLVIDLLRVVPKIIETNNIEDDTANGDDKIVLLKQRELVEDLIKAFDLLLLNQPLGKVLIDYLTNDNYLSQLFYEDGRKQGYKSKHLKNKFSSGVFFSLCEFFTTHSSTIEDADKNKLFKLLEKLSSKNDEKKFGKIGGLISVYHLLQSNPNEDNEKSLWYIVHDMWKAQGYVREE